MDNSSKGKRFMAIGIVSAILILIIYFALMELTGLVYTSVGALVTFIFVAIGISVVFTVVQAVIVSSLRRTGAINARVNIVKYSLCVISNYIPLWLADVFSPEVYLPFKGLLIVGTMLAVLELGLTFYSSKIKGQ
ncbi:MAG: hypothetical protein ATN33_01775 [Epulopiscium sp. Nele67-Bin001]|nr:MAG: hypothetical protein BEN18_06955 [Epulopiscium sp. Nuni2H_MBin001]OON91063.1 MAG: hypothetical protein ATN33_01775 [Epulopiscium sp. Nele67-Bin001]